MSANYDKLQDVGAQGWGLTDVVGTGPRSSNYTLRHSNGRSGHRLRREGEGDEAAYQVSIASGTTREANLQGWGNIYHNPSSFTTLIAKRCHEIQQSI